MTEIRCIVCGTGMMQESEFRFREHGRLVSISHVTCDNPTCSVSRLCVPKPVDDDKVDFPSTT